MATRGAAGAQGRWRLGLARCRQAGRHSPRELKRVAVSCLGEPEARVEMRKPTFTSQGTAASVGNRLSSGGSKGNEGAQKTAPPLGQENDQGGHVSKRKDQAMAW